MPLTDPAADPNLLKGDSTDDPNRSNEEEDFSIGPETHQSVYPNFIRNFFTIAFYQIILRTGWIFKTESIIMPAVLDSLGGAGWLRGFLPSLNRFGQSIPPLVAARTIKHLPQKKFAVMVCAAMMGVCFLGLSLLWTVAEGASWLKYAFLGIYAVFFITVGLHQISFNTLLGKLIPAVRRGRLVAFSNLLGCLVAVACAAILLTRWLSVDGGAFEWLFGFAGGMFVIGSLALFIVREERDELPTAVAQPILEKFKAVGKTIRADASFARLCLISGCFGSSMMLFPHYQN